MNLFDLITSPLSLNINPIVEWIIMFVIGEIAFRFAYRIVGELQLHSSSLNSLLHWIFRFLIYVAIWAIFRGATDLLNSLKGGLIKL